MILLNTDKGLTCFLANRHGLEGIRQNALRAIVLERTVKAVGVREVVVESGGEKIL
jgi:hypothetical protein